MVSRDDILKILQTIDDPEMPISIVDLGMVGTLRIEPARCDETLSDVFVDLLPTFVGCIALPVIEETIRSKVSALPEIGRVTVTSSFAPPWTVDRITENGRAALRKHGITVPGDLTCPFCNSNQIRLDSPFGPTRCRTIYYCEQCRHPFEQLKRLDHGPLVTLNVRRDIA